MYIYYRGASPRESANSRKAGQKAGQVASVGSRTCIVGSRGGFGGAIPTREVSSDQFQGTAVDQNKEGRPHAKFRYMLYTNKYFAHSPMHRMTRRACHATVDLHARVLL